MRLRLASLAGVLILFSLAGPTQAAEQNTPSPLRLLPAETEFFVRVSEPHKVADLVTSLDVFAKAQQLAIVKNRLDVTSVRRALQLLAHVEKRMGDKWPALLGKLASGGVVVGGKFGDKAPALLVIQGDDEKATKQFAALAVELLEEELVRQESKEKVEKRSEKDHDAYQVGKDFFAARLGAAIVVSNNKDTRDKAVALYRGEQKKSLAADSRIAEAAKLPPKKALADAWLDLTAAHKSEGAKGLFGSPRDNSQLTLLFGAYVDVIGRSPFLCAALTQEKEGYSLTIRAPRGRDGMGPDKALHLPEKDQPSLLPLLEPKGVIYSTSFHFDFAKIWQDRDKLFTKENADEFTKNNRNSALFTLGTASFAQTLESVGTRHRFVVAGQSKSAYKRTPKAAVQSYGFVVELRKPEKFGRTMAVALRGLGVVLSNQFNLERKTGKHGGIDVVSYRFDEKKELDGDENDTRFGYSPSYARVGNSFIFSSTQELCHDLIDGLKAEHKKVAVETKYKSTERFYANGFARLLEDREDQLVTQAILDQAIEPAEAKKQVRELIDFVKGLGDVTSHVEFKDKETHYTFRFGK